MADGVFNRAKGAAHQLALDNGTAWQVILLKAAEADDTLDNYDDMSTLLAAAGNTEADFTNYARKTGLTVTVGEDDTANNVDLDIPDQTWTSAGNGTNNTLVKALVCVQTGENDTTLIPIVHLDFTPTTDGSDLTIQFDANGFYRAS